VRQADRYLTQLKAYIESGPSDQGEYRLRCPKHGERRASASANPEKGPSGSWYCQVCEEGGSLKSLAMFVEGLPDDDPRKMKSTMPAGSVIDLDEARRGRRNLGDVIERLSESKVDGWHRSLIDNHDALTKFINRRGLSLETIYKFKIGWDSVIRRYTIPIYDEEGTLCNIRKYSFDPGSKAKLWNAKGHGSPPQLYPISSLEANEIVIVEGELDALIAIDHGFAAVSGTGGAKRWDPLWSKLFQGKKVWVSYDNDQEGRAGARKVRHSLLSFAEEVLVLPALVDEDKSDITDFFMMGGSPTKLRQIMAETHEPAKAEAEALKEVPTATDVRVIGSMDSRLNGKPLAMAVTITGRKDPTYSVPHRLEFECTMDAGAKCKVCPMMTQWEGSHQGTIHKENTETISQFIDAKKASSTDIIRASFGIKKCDRLEVKEVEALTVEELFVMSSVDSTSHDQTDYTQRRIYNVGSDGSTPTNTEVRVVGTTTPSPRDRRNEFYSWGIERSVTSIDSFKVTSEMVRDLSIFRPRSGQSVLDKCWEIAEDLSANVTHIIGRQRLHIAMDLVWHSALHFPFEGRPISRGWLELLVVGDTRTGKSETAIKLASHYDLGHIVGCEGATFAGLVGGVKEVGGSRTITWGEITVNDRRLVVLDEASGLSQDIIGQLSDVRSRGKAQITKIETATTNARCRSIWISNPRKSLGEKHHEGVDVITGLIGNPEDIARFDLAMSVSKYDVSNSIINSPDRPIVPHVYTSDLCQKLVLWAWSRKADQVQWKPDALQEIYRDATKLGDLYVEDPPLIQGTNVREKLARISVAFAARTFSTDDSGECIVVEREHVLAAAKFIHKLYSYDNFGYRRKSKRILRNKEIARENREEVKKWLLEDRRILEFLTDLSGSFRSNDLEEMAHIERVEVNHILGKLSSAKMISKTKSQIIIESELNSLLRELETRREK
jgi:hypothetical protein